MVVEERRMTHVALGRVKIVQAAFHRIVRKEACCSNQLPAVFAYEEGDSGIRTRPGGHCVESAIKRENASTRACTRRLRALREKAPGELSDDNNVRLRST